ncbi:MAG: FAD-dependent oxidoreductase [Candidatus Omnitrophota bacterium]
MQGVPLKKKYKYVVIGAGISGLTTACELLKAHPGEVLVLEREAEAGGMARTLSRQGYQYDLGSHRIHKDIGEEELCYLQQLMGPELMVRQRAGKLRFGTKHLDYPIETLQFFSALGIKELWEFVVSWARRKSGQELSGDALAGSDTYEGYLRRQVGDRVYRLFYEPYARKVFGLDPALISVLAAKKRVSMLCPLAFLKKILRHLWGGQSSGEFYYFSHGIGSLAKALEQKIVEHQGAIMTEARELGISESSGPREISFALPDGERHTVAYDALVSTMPIDALCRKLGFQADVERRMWRGLRLVFLHLSKPPALTGETFYYPESKYPFGRVSIPQRFSSLLQPDGFPVSYICEVPCSPGDPWWEMPDKDIGQICFKALHEAELVSPETTMDESLNFTWLMPEVYAVYFLGWEKSVQTMLDFLALKNPYVYSSGRLGLFLHCNMDHAMMMGRELASGLLNGMPAKDWYARSPEWHQMKVRD